jgi:hypothetical protein
MTKKCTPPTVARRLPTSSAAFAIQDLATYEVTVNLGVNRGFRIRIPAGSPTPFPEEDSTFIVFQYNFQHSIPPNPSTRRRKCFTRESVRSLLFELFPQQEHGTTPLPLLPAIECTYGPKPLIPDHLMGPPITPFALS